MSNIIKRVWNQNRMVTIEDLRGMAFQAEDGGHTFEISGINDANETVDLSGTVAGVFMRPDGTDVALTGTASDGVVSVTLDDDCYAVAGRFGLTIFVTADSKTTCVYACVGTVAQTSYGTVAGDTPQDVVDLINEINAAIASIPADYTDLMAAIAPTYSSSALYAKGAYAWYDGVLYKAIVDISTAESFTAAHWTAVALADDVADLKSAFDEKVASKYTAVEPINWFDGSATTVGILNANGTVASSTTRIYTDFIPVSEGDVIRQFYNTSNTKIYRRNICCYDASKNVLAAKGTDSAGNGTWTVPSGVSYIRMTIDKTYETKAIITKNLDTVSTYVAYFAPYDILSDDFLTPESEAAVQKIIQGTLSTKDLANRYACALLKGYTLRQTIGLPESWFYANMVSPLTPVAVNSGSDYVQRYNDKLTFPNATALDSANGYSFYVYDMLLNIITQDTGSAGYGRPRKIVAESLSNCSCLVIGDSTIDFDTMTQKMLDYFTSKSKTLTLLGTLGSGSNKNEGRAGWKATDYLTSKTYDGVTNPFYNPTSGTFDFSYYMTNQGYSAPNFVVLQLGINDLYNNASESVYETTWNAIKTMIDSIIAYNSSIKILLNLPTPPNSDQSVHSVFLPTYQNRVVKYAEYAIAQALSLYGETKVRPTYCHLILDPATDIRDNVHPTNDGFEKMAKEVINQINCWQNGY